MIPLRVQIDLNGPIERPARPIHLDALVAHQLVEQTYPAVRVQSQIRALLEELPFDRATVGSDWVWTASSLAFHWISPPMQSFAKRDVRAKDIAAFAKAGLFSNLGSNSLIKTSTGLGKPTIYAHEQQWASKAVAYCIGDAEIISSLLSTLSVIGARRRITSVQVTAVNVRQEPVAATLWRRRYLPVGGGGGRLIEGAYRLPLWDREHQTIVEDNSLTWEDVERTEQLDGSAIRTATVEV